MSAARSNLCSKEKTNPHVHSCPVCDYTQKVLERHSSHACGETGNWQGLSLLPTNTFVSLTLKISNRHTVLLIVKLLLFFKFERRELFKRLLQDQINQNDAGFVTLLTIFFIIHRPTQNCSARVLLDILGIVRGRMGS